MTHASIAAELIRGFAAARNVAVTTASRLLAGNGDSLSRLERGALLTASRAAAIARRAEELWPPTSTRRPLEQAQRALSLLARAESAAAAARAHVLAEETAQ